MKNIKFCINFYGNLIPKYSKFGKRNIVRFIDFSKDYHLTLLPTISILKSFDNDEKFGRYIYITISFLFWDFYVRIKSISKYEKELEKISKGEK